MNLDADAIQQHWALIVAAVLFGGVLLLVLARLYGRSAAGQLRTERRKLKVVRSQFARAQRRTLRAEKRLQDLQAKSSRVKPRVLGEAEEAVADSRALEKIASDRVLVAANHLRRVIFQEFPPHRHEALRRRYLPDDKPDDKPFSCAP